MTILPLSRQVGSVGHNEILSVQNEVRIEMDFNHQTGKSQNKLSEKFKVSPMTINRPLKKLDIKYRERALYPKASNYQIQRIKDLAKNKN